MKLVSINQLQKLVDQDMRGPERDRVLEILAKPKLTEEDYSVCRAAFTNDLPRDSVREATRLLDQMHPGLRKLVRRVSSYAPLDMTDFTPEDMESILPKGMAEQLRQENEVMQQLAVAKLERARKYLDDDCWQIRQTLIWTRRFRRKLLTYHVSNDRFRIDRTWYDDAFRILYTMRQDGTLETDRLPPRDTKGRMVIVQIPSPAFMDEKQRQWWANIPPDGDTLRKGGFGYDSNWQVLTRVNPDRMIAEIILPSETFVSIDGKKYLAARIASQLIIGNPHGVTGAEYNEAVSAKYPKVEEGEALVKTLEDTAVSPLKFRKRPSYKRRNIADIPVRSMTTYQVGQFIDCYGLETYLERWKNEA